MTVAFLRRRKLGSTSCKEIVRLSSQITAVARSDLPISAEVTTIIRWGTTSTLPAGISVINSAEAIHRVNNKTQFRRTLMDTWYEGGSVGMPLCPNTWFDTSHPDTIILPVIVRPQTHAQGKHVYLARTPQELATARATCGPGHYISSFIDKVAEYRVALVQGRVAWVANKTPGNPNDIAWNVAKGGRFDNVSWGDWPLKAVRVAREAFLLSGLDFGGVDVMVDAAGNAYVLEINSAPSLTSPYRQEAMAKCFDWLITHGKENIPVIQGKGGWRKFIHPALSDETYMVN